MPRRSSDWHWRGFLRPVRRDPVFWFAVAVSVLALVPQLALLGWHPDQIG